MAEFAFRRLTDPFLIPTLPGVASQVEIGIDFRENQQNFTSFCVVNSFPIWVRLRGSGRVAQIGARDGAAPTFKPVEDGRGWLFPPGFMGVFSTQYPKWVSGMAVERPGFPIKDDEGNPLYPNAVLELSYGRGGD